MELFVRDVILRCGGRLLCGDESLPLNSFSKDTRTIKRGDVYIGIKGDNFNGNLFYMEAFDKGASVCILDEEVLDIPLKYRDKTIVIVDDVILAIGKLAKYKRSLFKGTVIGITGSVGKTSTKEIIYNVLKRRYKTLKTIGNYNNNIGLPLTILGLSDEEVMVLEMGMNSFGEIDYLSDIARPNIGVITNIGTAHIGKLGSRENIMKAKLEIMNNLDGTLIINNDNDILHDNLDYIRSLGDVTTIGVYNDSDYMGYDVYDNGFYVDGNEIMIPVSNMAFVYNSLIAYVVGKLCKVDICDIRSGISEKIGSSNRLEYKKMNGYLVIDDTYNSSLDSISSSLDILKREKGSRHIAVIGDVLEVGSYEEEIHKKIGKLLLDSDLDMVITIGKSTLYTYSYLIDNGYEKCYHYDNVEDASLEIGKLFIEGDVILFKASHGMRFSYVISSLSR